MLQFLEGILEFVKHYISIFGFWGVGAGMFIESACIPLPSEAVLPLGGILAYEGKITFLEAFIASCVGSLLGSYLAYFVGKFGGRPFIIKFGKYFFVSEEHFNKADATFNKYGIAAVFFGRLLPVIRTFISLPAGIARMNLGKFTLFSLLGMIPWNLMLIFLGFKFGEKYETVVRPIFKKFEYGFVAIMVVAVIVFIVWKFVLPNRKKASATDN